MSNSSLNIVSFHATRDLNRGEASQPLRPAENDQHDSCGDIQHRVESDVMPRADESSQEVCNDDLTRSDLTGLFLGPYALGRKIGEGGMGTVFVARHMRLDKKFAMKFIATDVASIPEGRARFEQEIQALGTLRHPNIVNAVDAGCANGMQYLVTEFADGKDFEQLVQQHGPIPVEAACELILQTALGLEHSHRAGFVHRDIKPSNMILDRSGVVKILDFGLVRNASAANRLTDDGRTFGTLDFIAPEQAHDASRVDARADIYSLGCTLLYLLTGRLPFSDARYSSAAAKLKGHLFDRPDSLAQISSNVPKKLVRLIDRMIAKSPSARIQTAQEVAEKLGPFASSKRLSILTGAGESGRRELNDRSLVRVGPRVRWDWNRIWLVASVGSVAFLGWAAFNSNSTADQRPSDQPPLTAPQSIVADLPVQKAAVIDEPPSKTTIPDVPPQKVVASSAPPQIISAQEEFKRPLRRQQHQQPQQPQIIIQTW